MGHRVIQSLDRYSVTGGFTLAAYSLWIIAAEMGIVMTILRYAGSGCF
ncbi:hypothetical protein [Rhizobium ruizarguesonis]|nr:hypothetical protein [Rhizobium ruizarguesonis]